MLEKLFLMLRDLPNELITVIVAALPVSELRGAIPLALLSLKEPLLKTILLSISGNLLPVIPLLLFLGPVSEKVRHYLFERTRRKAAIVEKYEALGLALFVAIPLPVTGAWTGCIAASLFKIRFRYAFLAICVGVCMAAAIVTTITLIGKGIFLRLFLAQ